MTDDQYTIEIKGKDFEFTQELTEWQKIRIINFLNALEIRSDKEGKE